MFLKIIKSNIRKLKKKKILATKERI